MDGTYTDKMYIINITHIDVIKQGKYNQIDDYIYKIN